MSGRLLTIYEAARDLDRRPDTVLELIRSRSLRALAVQPHGHARERLRLPDTELDRWLRERYLGDPADIRRRNREAFDRAYRARVDVAAQLQRRRPVRHASVSPAAASRKAAPAATIQRTAAQADTDPLIARKLKVEAAVCRFHGRRARTDPGFFTTCSLTLDDGIPIRWRYWPATGGREYLPFDAAG